jgi:hypothetical protein
MDVSLSWSRVLSIGTTAYGLFALARPRHLASAMQAPVAEEQFYDRLAIAYGVRDLAIGGVGALGPARAVPAAIGLRIVSDVTDAVVLSRRAHSADVRRKALAITLGYAALNAGALAVDSRRG